MFRSCNSFLYGYQKVLPFYLFASVKIRNLSFLLWNLVSKPKSGLNWKFTPMFEISDFQTLPKLCFKFIWYSLFGFRLLLRYFFDFSSPVNCSYFKSYCDALSSDRERILDDFSQILVASDTMQVLIYDEAYIRYLYLLFEIQKLLVLYSYSGPSWSKRTFYDPWKTRHHQVFYSSYVALIPDSIIRGDLLFSTPV